MIGTIEDAIIARLTVAYGGRVREVDHKPAKLDVDELVRILTEAPGAYVSFLGWQRLEQPRGCATFTWGVYLVAANASGERARRRGDQATIGAYEMAVVAAGTLEGLVPDGATGPIMVRSCENLFAAAFEKAGRTVYGLVLEVPAQLQDGYGVPGGDGSMPDTPDLADFVILNAQWDVPPIGNVAAPLPAPNPDAEDRVILPQ